MWMTNESSSLFSDKAQWEIKLWTQERPQMPHFGFEAALNHLCWKGFALINADLVGGFKHFIFHYIYGMSSFPSTNSYFLRWLKPPTRLLLTIINHIITIYDQPLSHIKPYNNHHKPLLHHQPAMCGSNVRASRRASRQESADVSRLGPHWQQFRGPFFWWFHRDYQHRGDGVTCMISMVPADGWTTTSTRLAKDDSNKFPNFQEFRNLSHNFRFFRALCVKMCESKCSNVMVILDWSHCLSNVQRTVNWQSLCGSPKVKNYM